MRWFVDGEYKRFVSGREQEVLKMES
jgi:hypothetical protein